MKIPKNILLLLFLACLFFPTLGWIAALLGWDFVAIAMFLAAMISAMILANTAI